MNLDAFVLSTNVARRQMTKAQSAIVVAQAYPSTESKGGRGEKGCVSQQFPMVDKGLLSYARLIVKWNPGAIEKLLRPIDPMKFVASLKP
jgi:hypothetical protein